MPVVAKTHSNICGGMNFLLESSPFLYYSTICSITSCVYIISTEAAISPPLLPANITTLYVCYTYSSDSFSIYLLVLLVWKILYMNVCGRDAAFTILTALPHFQWQALRRQTGR